MTGRIAASVCVLAVCSGALLGAQDRQDQRQAQDLPEVQGPVYTPGGDVRPPTLKSEVKPTYTDAAMHAGITGEVWVDAVVTTEGRVADLSVARSIDGLDEAALTAAGQWQFEPGTLNGDPVNTRVKIILDFRLGSVPSSLRDSVAVLRRAGAMRDLQRQTVEEFERGAWRATAEGVTPPSRLRVVSPRYTSEGMRQKIQGIVGVDAVVMPDGTVDRARVASSLDTEFGLDDQALEAALASTFEPNSGTLGGNPVPVIVRLNLEFRIH